MGAGIGHEGAAGVGGLVATHLHAVVPDLLGMGYVENGQSFVGVDTQQDGCADLREDLSLFSKAYLNIVQDRVLTKVVEREQVFFAIHVCLLHLL